MREERDRQYCDGKGGGGDRLTKLVMECIVCDGMSE